MSRKGDISEPTVVSSWPSCRTDLIQLLDLDVSSSTCRGHTQKQQRCRNRIRKDSWIKVNDLAHEIVAAGRLTHEALSSLKLISILVLCFHHRESQAVEIMACWREHLVNHTVFSRRNASPVVAVVHEAPVETPVRTRLRSSPHERELREHPKSATTGITHPCKLEGHQTAEAHARVSGPPTTYPGAAHLIREQLPRSSLSSCTTTTPKQHRTQRRSSHAVEQKHEPTARTDSNSLPRNRCCSADNNHPISIRGGADTCTSTSTSPAPTSSSLLAVTSPSNTHYTFVPYNFRPLSVHELNTAIAKKLSARLTDAERSSKRGSIYGFTFPASFSPSASSLPIKIGSSISVPARMRAISHTCGFPPQMIFCVPFSSNFRRHERIVHAMLQNARLRSADPCLCNSHHREWFTVGDKEAERTVILWSVWATLDPYGYAGEDSDGELRPFWRERLRGVRLGDERCWEDFVYGGLVEERWRRGTAPDAALVQEDARVGMARVGGDGDGDGEAAVGGEGRSSRESDRRGRRENRQGGDRRRGSGPTRTLDLVGKAND